ncbi:MAG: D-glycero-beta-D-manno-heptose-7-phosphate kinase [Thermodesulfovibrio sp.]|uniref:D-glycero-beta-D-manno-heptose-7-phosphate kinase n=1 Tax=unclassified Thermodesulfovibrio TaxID=2645936 RepID=UPI00083AA86C|nr:MULTISPECIES: D-glycero-beta-D-manno-heptose-7-phosphate kinase [unclassified Thermodesulfovibrio]MDI1472356.1 D-glycero-beta-D-manno-heptose-7-phosphate kinase [Thermodesulfovibrio sp. 1176]MDI6714221.1 D-glycero-beta-D-manno-heptose-7-phosphate kinase [Thermodesulfovibrio sp.]ODA43358.1 ADP-heptose synthase [Thermodesulfovibrio sp. N1]
MTLNKLENLLKIFHNKKILVIGDIILDRYIFGKVSRISPEAPVPVVEVTEESYRLGGAANVANNLIALGGKAYISGIIGKGSTGKILKDLLEEKGIGIDYIFEDNRRTTVKTRIIAGNQQIVRFDIEDHRRLEGKAKELFLSMIKSALNDFDAIIVSDYKKGVISEELFRILVNHKNKNGNFVAVDPKVGHFRLYKQVSLITPNIAEASHGAEIEIKDEKTLIKAGFNLLKKLSCDSVLITRGEEGMSLFEKKDSDVIVTHLPTVAKKVFDVTGAGDTVIATITLAHVSGADLIFAAKIANVAAGIVVGKVGTATATQEEIMEVFKTHPYA